MYDYFNLCMKLYIFDPFVHCLFFVLSHYPDGHGLGLLFGFSLGQLINPSFVQLIETLQ